MTKPRRPRVSLNLLMGFDAAARSLSFTKAAQELCVTQSAISRQIKTLEDQLGFTLFKRMNRGLALTVEGGVLHAAVESAVKLIGDCLAKLQQPGERRTITIAAAAPFASFWLASRLSQFAADHPGYDIRVLPSSDPADIERSIADIGIWHFNPRRAPAGEPLAVDEVLPVCAPSLAARRGMQLRSPSDLTKHVLLQFENFEQGRRRVDWVRWLDAMGLSTLLPAGTIGFTQYDQVVRAAIDGNGVALGRLPLVTQFLRDGALVAPFPKLRISTGTWRILLSTSSRDRLGVRELVDWCRLEAGRDATLDETPASSGP